MENRKKIYCHHDIVRFVTKEKFIEAVGEDGILSVTEGEQLELMIFLGKEENGENYEVRVYKEKPKNKYVPHMIDEFVKYEENKEYASFFFDDFSKGIKFIYCLPACHPEYHVRPVREIKD